MRWARAAAAGVLAAVVALALAPAGALAEGASTPAPDDAYLKGYATAVLEQQLALEHFRVTANDGVVRVRAAGLQPGDADRIRAALADVAGVREVVVEEGVAPDGPPAAEPAARANGEGAAPTVELFPERKLFGALLADPRWPRFGIDYQRYLADPELGNVGAASFGESFALVGGRVPGLRPGAGRWEMGIQGGVFSIFDLDAASMDLVNSDFLGGLTLAYRRGAFSTLLRFFHQSSHLGDEFLLRNRVDRINLSFEELDWLLSYELFGAVRPYVGAGVLVRSEPDLDPASVQTGLELTSPWAFWHGRLRPVAAVDLQLRQESDWRTDRSVVAGLQLESRRLSWLRLQMLAEYYAGRSPNGQFFERQVEYAGFGLRLAF